MLIRARHGDAAALSGLLRRCHPTIYRWALVHTGDPDDADDVAQEVLVRLHTRLDRFGGRSQFTTWLYQVTRNTAFGLRRRLVSRVRGTRRWDRAPPNPEDPVEHVHAEQIVKVVAELFRALPARQREIFHLADLEGLTPSEIAARLGMNAVTVRTNLLRARRALRSRILEQHPEIAEERTE